MDEFLEKIKLLALARNLNMNFRVYVTSAYMEKIKDAVHKGIIVEESDNMINSLLGFPLILSDRIPDPPGYLLLPEPKFMPFQSKEYDDDWIFRARLDNPLVDRDPIINTNL